MQATAIQDFLNDLQKRIDGTLRTDTYSLTFYSTDASNYQVKPYGVLIPKHTDDMQAAVELAAKYKLPVLPRAAGSSLAGQAVNDALIIDVTPHLDKIIEVNPEEKWVRAQPGVVLDTLNAHLKPTGLQFGPDPASSNRAALGGIVGNNSTGSHSIIYGMAADHVLETRVILSDGSQAVFGSLEAEQVAQRAKQNSFEGRVYHQISALAQNNVDTIRAKTPRHWRRCGGYNLDRLIGGQGVTFQYPQDPRFNLAKLMVGSEGTLGVISQVKLNLVPRPTKTALAIVPFDTLQDALKATPVILQTQPSAVELLDNLSMRLCRDVPAYARLLKTFTEGRPYAVLITEFYGESETELTTKLDNLQNLLKQEKSGAGPILPLMAPDRQSNVWAVRKAGLGLLMSMKGDYKPLPFIEDSAVPVEHLADYVAQIQTFCKDLGTEVAYYAHASGGCLHIRPVINAKVAAEVDKLPKISQFVTDLLRQYNGVWSSEHGDGRSRSWLNEKFFGPELYGLYKDVKRIFDPDNIMNPGNIVDMPGAITDNLRYGSTYTVIPLKEHLDFSDDQGFHRAIEMCNGAGVCRKLTGGTMCPSFMVTRDEEHSTRGRANALRAALSGALPAEELTGKRMYQVLDLCIECKACKTECPSSVDMAKIKFEFLSHYYDKHGVPLRSKIFADIAFWSHLSSGVTAPMVNRIMNNPLTHWGLEKFLGISAKRDMPTFAKEPFTRWFKNRKSKIQNPKSKIVLFNDTFSTYNYPHIAIAATEVLEAAGFEIILPGHKCCGRPMISKGLVNKARRAANDTINRLYPLAKQGLPIVGLEPSCLLSMRDDYFYLLPNDKERVKLVAEHCYTFEEFIANLSEAGQLNLNFEDTPRQVLLHGHCQQKALSGTEAGKKVLSLPANYTVSEVDSGCCGMAGSFGYEAEHYNISMAMAERRLLPAIRKQGREAVIAAAGTSCRQQIKHGTGQQALHPAEVLRGAMK